MIPTAMPQERLVCLAKWGEPSSCVLEIARQVCAPSYSPDIRSWKKGMQKSTTEDEHEGITLRLTKQVLVLCVESWYVWAVWTWESSFGLLDPLRFW